MRYNFVRAEWKTIDEFPSYEINALGIVRNRKTKIEHSIQAYDYETVMLTRNGRRFHRSIRTLLKKTFPELG